VTTEQTDQLIDHLPHYQKRKFVPEDCVLTDADKVQELFEQFPDEARNAEQETLGKPRELGPWADDEKYIFKRLRELNKQHNGPKIVIGGPPCQAYSTVGRARNKGIKGYKAANDKRYFLYEEYSKVLQ